MSGGIARLALGGAWRRLAALGGVTKTHFEVGKKKVVLRITETLGDQENREVKSVDPPPLLQTTVLN